MREEQYAMTCIYQLSGRAFFESRGLAGIFVGKDVDSTTVFFGQLDPRL